MKIPQYIVADMHRAARHFQGGAEIMRRVDEWFISNGYDIDELRCGDGLGLEEIEYGNDITDSLIEKLEGKNERS